MIRSRPRASLGVLALTVFLDLLGFGFMIPLLPHYAETLGASPFVYGLLAASYSLMQFVFVPIWGRWSDRLGRRPILLVSIAGSAVSFALLGLARSLPHLFLARVLSGIATSNLSVAQAYVADVTTPEERAQGMGVIGAAFGLGFVVGPFVGGELSRVSLSLPFGLTLGPGTVPFFAAASLSTLNWILAFRLLPASRPAGLTAQRPRVFDLTRLRVEIRRREITTLLLVSALVTVAFSMMEQTLILFGERRVGMTPPEAGRLLGFVGVLMVIIQGGLVGRLVRRHGEGLVLVAGTACLVPGLLLIPASRGWPLLIVAMVPLALGSGLLHPSLNALLSRRSPKDEQGGMLGLNQSLSSLARVLGPSVGGWLFQEKGIGTPYVLGGVIAAAATVVAIAAVRADRNGDALGRVPTEGIE